MILHVKLKPNQRFNKIEKTQDSWQIRLHAPAIDGKANDHLITYLAEVLQISKSSIQITKGLTSRFKTLSIFADADFIINILENEAKK